MTGTPVAEMLADGAGLVVRTGVQGGDPVERNIVVAHVGHRLGALLRPGSYRRPRLAAGRDRWAFVGVLVVVVVVRSVAGTLVVLDEPEVDPHLAHGAGHRALLPRGRRAGHTILLAGDVT